MENKLEDFIKSTVTAQVFEKLADRLGITATKLTRIFNRPADASKDDVLNLAALVKVSPGYLISEYKMGYNNITLDDFDDIKKIA